MKCIAMIKVLLVDDDVELLDMLQDYLEQEGFETLAVHDGEQGVSEALSGRYAIAILDVMMGRTSGIDVLKRIRQQSQMPVLMLTAKGDDADRIIGLEFGADDYVPKPCTPRELVARIRAILRRTQDNGVAAPMVLSVGPLTMWPEQRRATWAGNPLDLTSTEFSLLEVLARNPGRPVSKSELSERAMGRPLGRCDRSIDVHFSSIRHKLGTLSDGRSCIQTVYRLGYQLIRE
jgi:two-component system, OmpR family, response regulator